MRKIYEDPKTGRYKWREKQPVSEPPVLLQRVVLWLREIVWAYRVKKCWRQAEGDYGQFLSNIGCDIAYGKLPRDILKLAGFTKPENEKLSHAAGDRDVASGKNE